MMGVRATARFRCDNCGAEADVQLEPTQTPDDALDLVGFERVGMLLDRVLCGRCSEDGDKQRRAYEQTRGPEGWALASYRRQP